MVWCACGRACMRAYVLYCREVMTHKVAINVLQSKHMLVTDKAFPREPIFLRNTTEASVK